MKNGSLAVYSSTHERRREKLWNTFATIAQSIILPWVVAGDFNQVADPEERKGGFSGPGRSMHRFAEWVDRCRLIDMGWVGPRFTWLDS